MARWDHVVVGAGSSGAVVAELLSADPARSVLVLEAGPDPASAGFLDVVGGADFFAAAGDPALTWPGLTATPMEGGTPAPYLQGRVVGGTGAVNGMVLQRPLPGDLGRWDRVHGLAGWGGRSTAALADEVLAAADPVAAGERGRLARAWMEAARGDAGVRPVDQPGDGVSPAALARRHGRRWSSGDRLLAEAARRSNLTVRAGAHVDRVLVAGGQVAGIRLVGGEEVETGSVVLAAGALHTPGILVRSGLDRPGIGAVLRDHPGLQVTFALAAPPGTGPLVGVVERWSSAPGAHDLVVTPLEHVGDPTVGGISVALVAPHSVGRLRVTSLDPLAEPEVELGHLADERDLDRLAAAARRLAGRLAHPALEAAAGGPVRVDAVGTPAAALADAAFARAWVPGALGGSYHAAGTCRMGQPDDTGAVVDHRGSVHGVDGLWVADASILPELPRANPHLTCVVVGTQVAAAISR